jgi:hypothetical protein
MKPQLITIRGRGQTERDPAHAVFAQIKTLLAVLGIMVASAFQPARAAASGEEGIALAIVYDTSGSMREPVPAGPGKAAPKYVIANKALGAIVDRLSQYATNSPSGAPRKIEVGLYIFHDPGAVEAVPFGPFTSPEPLKDWVAHFSKPGGSTPLGNSIDVASRAVLHSSLSRKHLVILTDGINTSGPRPEDVIPRIKKTAQRDGTDISFHFVAFDVDAKVFDPVKKLGATVLGAANAQQLNTQLEFIFERKILLEDEEPKHPATDQPK